jgi:hypothetical protein
VLFNSEICLLIFCLDDLPIGKWGIKVSNYYCVGGLSVLLNIVVFV